MKVIAPKPRTEVDLRFYTTGEVSSKAVPSQFIKHIAEPGAAASIIQINPHHSEFIEIKPSTFRTSSVRDKYNPSITTISTLKQAQSRDYAK